MKTFIKFLFGNKTLAPAADPAAGTDGAGADTAPAADPDGTNPAPKDDASAEPPAKDTPPQEPEPWEVNVPKEYEQMLAPALEKYKTLGLTPKQAQTLIDESVSAVKKSDEAIDAELLSIKSKWGKEFDTRQQAAVNAMAQLGFNTKDAAALVGQVGLAAVLERFYEVSKQMAPGQLRDGKALVDMTQMDAQSADAEIERLSRDEAFCDKLAEKDPAATRRWERLKAIRRGETV